METQTIILQVNVRLLAFILNIFNCVQDKTLCTNEVNALRKQIEREYQERIKLEDAIVEKMRGQLTMDKAAQYTDKLTSKLRKQTKELVSPAALFFSSNFFF